MGELIDLDAYRRARAAEQNERKPGRRRTPGGREGDEDASRHLSVGLPAPGPAASGPGAPSDDETGA